MLIYLKPATNAYNFLCYVLSQIQMLLILLVAGAFCVEAKRPNIILIVADDLGWNDFGYHGSNQIKTPNIDALVYNGVVLERFYAQQSCSPSRAALLTGQYPIRTGFQGEPVAAGENRTFPHNGAFLPEELKKLGYATHLVGKWHLGASSEDTLPMAFGYDTHYGYWNGFIRYFDYTIYTRINGGMLGVDFHDGLVPVNETNGEDFTDLITKRAVDIIDCHSKSRKKDPIFLVLSHLAGHTTKPVGLDTLLEVRNETYTNEKYSYIPSPIRRMLAEIVENMDRSIGIVIDKLEKAQMLSNSIIFFISDNGGPTSGGSGNAASNFPLRGVKMQPYEGAIRVAATIYSSKCSKRGRIFNNLFHITDIAPTLIRAAGGDPSVLGKVDGIDQWDNVCYNKNQNKRTELLVNIDDVNNYESYIGYNGRYKYLKSKKFTFDNYTGEAGRYGTYDFQEVYDSPTNKAIMRLQHKCLIDVNISEAIEKYKSIRDNTTLINCRRATEPDTCQDGCLFDLFADPCEANNVSSNHTDIYDELQKKTAVLRDQAVPQRNGARDTNANPQIFCNGTWFPWLTPDGCFYNKTVPPLPPNYCL